MTQPPSFLRKSLAVYLSVCTLFAPIAPAFASSDPRPCSCDAKQDLPELGGSVGKSSPKSAPSAWLAQPHDVDLAPSVLRDRTKGVDEAVSMGSGVLSSAASAATESWLAAHHITSAVSLNIADGGIRGGSLDMLVPFYNAGKDLVFTQVGMRRANSYTADYRNTFNMGLGYRHETNGWLLGVNSFLDRDAQGDHDRLGLGVEAWTDFLKLSANSYKRLSNWKNSPDRADYEERAARGWDVRAEGYLPAYPQLGGQMIFEKYYGDEVSLFSANDRQKNPHAMTLGAIYNPVPLLSLGVNHRIGQDGRADSSANLTFNYRLGESFAKQVSSSSLIASRLVANARYDLVARNNEIVLDNRKNSVELKLPALMSGKSNETLPFIVTGASNFSSLSWVGTAAGFAGAVAGDGNATVTLPAYIDGGVNTYALQASGIDRSGRGQTSNVMTVNVLAAPLRVSAVPAVIVADGVSTTTLSAFVVDSAGRAARSGETVTWTTTSGSLASDISVTDSHGVAKVVLTSITTAGTVTVGAQLGSLKGSTTVTFAAGQPSGVSGAMTLTATPLAITADGTSTSMLKAALQDDQGNAVAAGHSVSWETTAGTLDADASVTDANGVASMKLTSATKAGVAKVQASISGGKQRVPVSFTPGVPAAGSSGLSLSATPNTIKSDGVSTSTLTARVMDAHGNTVLAGVPVSWSSSAGTLASDTSYTDTDGVATMTLTSTAMPGKAEVKASAGAANNAINVTFAASVPATGTAGLTLRAAPDSIPADGSSASILTATVLDDQGLSVGAGVQVDWTSSAGTLSSDFSTTDENGVATVSLVSPVEVGTARVHAAASAAFNDVDVTFTAGDPAAGTTGLALTTDPSVIEADGVSTSTLTAVVKDAQGNTVAAGVNVNWTTTAGTLSATTSNTDSNGVATTVLTSTATPNIATIQAQAGAAQNSARVMFVLSSAAAVSSTLDLTASATSLSADGISTSNLTAIVKDAQGNSVGAGIPVYWTTSSGGLSEVVSNTDANGTATTVLTSATTAGTADVQAVSGTADDQLLITFTPGAPAAGATGLVLTASLKDIPAGGTSTTTLKALVKDQFGNPVDAGVMVSWTTSAGTLASDKTVTDASGIARVQLTSPAAQGSANIGATAGAAHNTTSVTFSGPVPAQIAVTPATASIQGDGVSNTLISATLVDSRGMPMGAGVVVNWATSAGTLATDKSLTNASGIAIATLTSALGGGTASVEASVGSVTGTANVRFIVGAPAVLTVTPSQSSILADGLATSTLTATVYDDKRQPVGPGVVVYWTTAGNLAGSSSTTDTTGRATIEMTSSRELVTAVVHATADSASNSTNVRFVAGAPASMDVTPSPASIVADGKSTTRLAATIQDVGGHPVAGATVQWSTSEGSLANLTSVTNSAGVATVLMTSTRNAGSVEVEASTGLLQAKATVTYTVGVAGGLVLTATPTSITADGVSTSTIKAEVLDEHSVPVGAGVIVRWQTTAGTLAGVSSVTDANGIATMALTSSTTAGTANVEVSGGNTVRTVSVTFAPGAAAKLAVTSAADRIPADGVYSTVITATVKDAHDNLVAAGTPVSFTTSAGSLTNSTSTTNASGVVTVTLTSANQYTTATVNATAGAATGSKTVQFIEVVLDFAALPTHFIDGPIDIRVLVKDTQGKLLSGVTVNFEGDSVTSLGRVYTFNPRTPSALSGSDGVASVVYEPKPLSFTTVYFNISIGLGANMLAKKTGRVKSTF